jgi:AraC-like DNA-binding protein
MSHPVDDDGGGGRLARRAARVYNSDLAAIRNRAREARILGLRGAINADDCHVHDQRIKQPHIHPSATALTAGRDIDVQLLVLRLHFFNSALWQTVLKVKTLVEGEGVRSASVRYHFCRSFRHSFGVSPHRCHQYRRAERAKTLLANWALSVTDIGLDLGFRETSSLSTAFRSLYGAPTGYRRSLPPSKV